MQIFSAKIARNASNFLFGTIAPTWQNVRLKRTKTRCTANTHAHTPVKPRWRLWTRPAGCNNGATTVATMAVEAVGCLLHACAVNYSLTIVNYTHNAHACAVNYSLTIVNYMHNARVARVCVGCRKFIFYFFFFFFTYIRTHTCTGDSFRAFEKK